MTILGRHIEAHTCEITVCDPLAHMYSRIASKCRVQRPSDTEPAFAEFYPINTYDLVYYRNALDHSFDPVTGVREMLYVAKLGGRVYLEHSVNEAVFEEYSGFHQQNFNEDDGDLIAWAESHRSNVAKELADTATVTPVKIDPWLSAAIDKKPEPQFNVAHYPRGRLPSVLSSFLVASMSAPSVRGALTVPAGVRG